MFGSAFKPKFGNYLYAAMLLFPPLAESAPNCPAWLAKVISVQGQVHMQPLGGGDWQTVSKDDVFCPGDKIRTLKWSRSILLLSNDSVVTLDQNTTLIFPEPEERPALSGRWLLNLIRGSSFFRSRDIERLDVNTPFINAVHEGTEFLVTVDAGKATIAVFDGQVAGRNSQGRIDIKKGFAGIAAKGRPPFLQPLKITPEDAVQWALYYPPLFSAADLPASFAGHAQAANPVAALAELERIPAGQRSSRHVLAQASLLLTVGRADEAEPLIRQVLQSEPKNSDAYALQAIVAVAKNHPDLALQQAQTATTLNARSSAAFIALSYARQARFDIKAALAAAQTAAQLDAGNALAWARVSELQLSSGDREAALSAARRAQRLAPDLGRIQTVMGFSSLAQVDIETAKTAFNQAIALDSSDPLPRLGLGLAKIRQGHIEEGKTELETAVNLDPNSAIVRSYLGKAYYELRNKEYAGTELNLAKEMDPQDPTPWFYDAILKQTANRPVEALHDMQKAIELNDNRGVYRSSLLLDKDLASRSAAQGRTYNDLGFQRLGLLQGWKSLNVDPTNYSAHRLLSDNYIALTRYNIARVSELLQSQLLQPQNMTPIQPQLAESNLLLLDGLGPASQSFNEFNPLFTRDRFTLQASGIFGSNGTWGNETVQSGLWDRFSYSLGQFHYESNGFRVNNKIDSNLYTAFGQYAITPETNILAEFRDSNVKSGDLLFHFNINDFDKNLRRNTQTRTARIGMHHSFNENSNFIGLLTYLNRKISNNRIPDKVTTENLGDDGLGGNFIFSSRTIDIEKLNTEAFHFEAQQIQRIERSNFIFGFGFLSQSETQFKALQPNTTLLDATPFGSIILDNNTSVTESYTNRDANFLNTYLYSIINLYKNFDINIGVSFDSLDSHSLGVLNKVNPKIGFTWKYLPNGIFRAAYFSALKRPLISDQTVEPTQVAGFNQFFDDLNGAVTKRYGAAIDHQFTESFSGSAEISWRNLKNRIADSSLNHQREQLHRAYIYWTPNQNLALSAETNYERVNRDSFNSTDTLPNFISTFRVPLSINFFLANGVFSKLTATYVNQTVEKQQAIVAQQKAYDGSDRFWTLDAQLGFRLPKRYGIFSIGIKNLLDEKFNFEDFKLDTGVNSQTAPLFQPRRFLYTQVTLSF